MNIRRGTRLLLGAAVAALLAVTACGGGGGTPATPAASGTGGGATLTVWISDRVSEPGMAATETVLAAWGKQSGNTVHVVKNSFFDQMNKMPVAIPAGNGPDVFMLTNNYVGQFTTQSLIAPVTVPEATTKLLTEDSVGSFTLDGKLLGVPVAADVNALVYNKKLLPTVPATMDELVNQAAGMTKDGKYGLLFPIDQYWWDHAFMAGFGGYVFKSTGGRLDVKDIGLANEGSTEALRYLRGLVADRKLMPADTTADVATGLFKSGDAAAVITGPTSLPDFAKAGVDVGVAALPPLANGQHPKPFATYTGFSISGKSTQQERAADMLAYLAEHLPAELRKASAGNISVLKSAADQVDPAAAGWVAQLRHSEPLPSVPEMNQVFGPIGTAVTAVIHGKAQPGPALDEAVAAVVKAMG